MFKRLSAFVCLSFLLAPGSADAQFRTAQAVVPGEDYHVELGAMFWTPTPELRIQSGSLAAVGGEVDFVQEFGIEDKRFTEFRAVLKPGRKHKLRVHYVPIRYEEDAVLQREFVFGGRRFNVGLPANTEIEWKLWRFGYEWDFVSAERGYVGLITEVKYSQVTASVSSPIGSEFTDANAPVPAIGGVVRGYPSRHVSITGEFTGFKLPDSISEEYEAKFFDFDVFGTVNLGRHVGVQAGYRSLTVDYLADDDSGDLKMKGPYFGGVVRF